jgi:GT2 family glycosyltransferase
MIGMPKTGNTYSVDPLDRLYRQNKTYHSQDGDLFWILGDADGWGVAFDDPVYRVWSAFDGRPTDQVIAALTAETEMSAAFVEATAKVLARAGMLIPSRPLDPLPRVPSTDLAGFASFPLVSIIILASRQARVHLETCLPSVLAQTYPNLEIILVDNQTTDDSVAFTEQNFSQVNVISTPEPLGFGGANNCAMKRARGEFFFLVNEDTEMEPDCIAECVRVMIRSDKIAVVAPKMRLFYERAFLNSMGNSIQPDGHAYDNFIGYLDVGQFDETEQVFTACFGASLLRRSVVEQIGYMDEDYFVYYDDTDWSFRARLCGYDVVAAPQAVVYHKFNVTVDTLASTFRVKLVVHNRLRFVWKNLDFERAWRFTLAYREDVRRNIAGAKMNGWHDVVKTYRKAWRRWFRSVPQLAIVRWQTRRLRRPPFSDDAAFALADAIPRPTMHGRYPVISAPVIREHYMRLEIFKPDSPPAPEDLVPIVRQTVADVPSLGQKVGQALREKGVSGLIKETGQYLYWRFILSQ